MTQEPIDTSFELEEDYIPKLKHDREEETKETFNQTHFLNLIDNVKYISRKYNNIKNFDNILRS